MYNKYNQIQKQVVVLLYIFLIVAGVIFAKNFLYPLAFGVLFSYLLYPLTNFLEKKGIPRIISILFSILISLAVIAGIVILFANQLSNMFENFADIRGNANRNIEKLQHNLEDLLGLHGKQIENGLKSAVNNFFSMDAGSGIGQFFAATTGTLVRVALLPVYVFLFLYFRTKFAYFILKIVPVNQKRTTIAVLRDIATIAPRYMGGVTVVVMILIVLNSVGLLIIGVKYAILLGIISAVINFIPYFGTLLGGAVPLLFVLLTTDDPLYYAIRVIFLFIIIQFTENNILTPNIVGSNVKINAFFIIIGLVLAGMIWGIPGMLIIVPLIAILRIIFSHFEAWQPYAYLLGTKGTRRHSISIENIKKVFKSRKRNKETS